MTRIVYFTEAFWPSIGGVEVVGSRFAQAMMARGHEVEVITSRTDDESPDVGEYRGIRIHRFPFVRAVLHREVEAVAESMSRLAALYQRLQPDVYHVNLTGPSVLFHMRAAPRWSAPSVVAIRVAITDRREEGLLATRLLQSADWVTANSRRMLEHTRSVVPQIAARSSVIYNGLPLPDIEPVVPSSPDPRLLCLGRVVEDKGFDLALKAMPRVLEHAPGACLVIAGDGSAREHLASLAADLGVAHRVEFLGRVERDAVPALLNTVAAVVMPSRWEEAFGLVALEAAQMARPVVATRVGGLPEVVADEETGVLVPKEEPAALADAIIRLITDPERAEAMGRRAQARAEKVFGWDRYVDEYEALYKRLVQEYRTDVAGA